MISDDQQRTILSKNVLHIGAGFKDKERPHVLETLSTLGPHPLGRWDPRDMDAEVSPARRSRSPDLQGKTHQPAARFCGQTERPL